MTRPRRVLFGALVVVATVVGPAVAGGFGGVAPAGPPAPPADGGAVATDGLASATTDGLASATTDGLASATTDDPADATTDGLAEFSLKPGGTIAKPGETLRMLVFLRSAPQIASGAYEAGFVLAFDATALRARNVTRGRFMNQGANTTVRTNVSSVDNRAGVVRYGLERDPPNGGVAGYALFATVTFEVRPDAPEGRYDLTFRRTRVLLTDDNYQRVTSYGATVTVARSVTETPTATPTGTDGGPADAVVGAAVLVVTLGALAGVVVLVRRA